MVRTNEGFLSTESAAFADRPESVGHRQNVHRKVSASRDRPMAVLVEHLALVSVGQDKTEIGHRKA